MNKHNLSLTLICVLFFSPGLLLIRPLVETHFFPVVQAPVEITKMQTVGTGQSIRIHGVLRKLRECKFIGIEWFQGFRSGRAVRIELKFLEKNKIRSPGVSTFGPWEIRTEGKPLRKTYADVFHQCYFVGLELPWRTITHLYN